MADYIGILRRLWNGERITYNGPVGTFDGMSLAETYHGTHPQIWFGGYALPKGADLIARHCDGVLLVPMLTPEAVHDAVGRIRQACERIDRDPATVRICALVVTAPELDDTETRNLAHSRMVTYLTVPDYGEKLAEINHWNPRVVTDVREHRMFSNLDYIPDRNFHRHQMAGPGAAIPDDYMQNCSALGPIDQCIASLQRFRDAGADEIATSTRC